MASSTNRTHGEAAPAALPAPGHAATAGKQAAAAPSVTYERALARDPRRALNEASRHFEGKSAVFVALHKIAERLTELQIPYAIVGGMALFHHGLRRFTEYVDILVAKHDLKKIHAELAGRGYLPPHRQSKHLRDTELGVRIEFLTTGEFPGDGRPKPVAFPEPIGASTLSDGIYYVNLPTLIELKLASGMTSAGRLRDLADVLELIKLLNLPADFDQQLNPYVREKFADVWKQAKRRYVMLWRKKWPAAEAQTIAEMIRSLRSAADELEAMREDGVMLDLAAGGVGDDYVLLTTTDPEIAKKYDMVEESEFWGEADAEGSGNIDD